VTNATVRLSYFWGVFDEMGKKPPCPNPGNPEPVWRMEAMT